MRTKDEIPGTCARAGHWWVPAGKRTRGDEACKRCHVKRPKEKSS